MKALQLLKKQWKLGIVAAALDFVFIGVFTKLQVDMLLQMREHISTATEKMHEVSSQLNPLEIMQVDKHLAQSPEFMTAYLELVRITMWYGLSIFALWLLVKGAAWTITHIMAGNPPRTWISFIYTSLAGGTLSLGLFVLLTIGLQNAMLKPLTPSPTTITTLIAIGFLILHYLTTTMFAAGKFVNGFKTAFKRARSILPVWLGVTAGGVLILLAAQQIWTFHMLAGTIFALLIFPYLVFARLALIEVANARQA